ncbi:Type IV secretion system protein VirB9 precursor [Candidatus Fokinia solitaria]|uniref:Type IV secretion system protein VirB9 n=1 Tax=Candidatus Fokinia solitaria TaxID=1802984 RepID=A0A2U8BRS9_9RICK|nr:TrbG/VirB9 family P-type conjugative transfer protein [Candidatus Fokinia solitaria]AWD33003.1 Type IV secretion system protein VirB9 precursor [Candidatus Fokinia solitaria]
MYFGKKGAIAYFCVLALLLPLSSSAIQYDNSLTIDRRIQKFVYSPNQVFPLVLSQGYQTSIEFGEGEILQTYSLGNSYAWQLSVVGNTLFIKPIEDDVTTNMTVITNKRKYYFEIETRNFANQLDDSFAYVIRFFYPDTNQNDDKKLLTKQIEQSEEPVKEIVPYNFNYLMVRGNKNAYPSTVFDDSNSTYFQYKASTQTPKIFLLNGQELKPLTVQKVKNYYVVNTVAKNFFVKIGDEAVVIQNLR